MKGVRGAGAPYAVDKPKGDLPQPRRLPETDVSPITSSTFLFTLDLVLSMAIALVVVRAVVAMLGRVVPRAGPDTTIVVRTATLNDDREMRKRDGRCRILNPFGRYQYIRQTALKEV